jgi:predicted peptidase
MKILSILMTIISIQFNLLPQDGISRMGHKSLIKKATIDLNFNYLLYLPDDYDSSKKFPLVVFLHGAGERGNKLELVKRHGPPKLIQEGSKFPFILVAPQCPEGRRWTHFLLELSLLIDDIQSNYSVDENRIYLTGLSMGGQGTWALAIYNPDKFAAIAPICGWTDTFEACKLKELPIWVFHGEKDKVVTLDNSEKMVEAIKSCGSTKIKFTIYPEIGHDSWTETYNNPEFYEWLLSNKKNTQ